MCFEEMAGSNGTRMKRMKRQDQRSSEKRVIRRLRRWTQISKPRESKGFEHNSSSAVKSAFICVICG
jgi:hypothetical protein